MGRKWRLQTGGSTIDKNDAAGLQASKCGLRAQERCEGAIDRNEEATKRLEIGGEVEGREGGRRGGTHTHGGFMGERTGNLWTQVKVRRLAVALFFKRCLVPHPHLLLFFSHFSFPPRARLFGSHCFVQGGEC